MKCIFYCKNKIVVKDNMTNKGIRLGIGLMLMKLYTHFQCNWSLLFIIRMKGNLILEGKYQDNLKIGIWKLK